MGVSSRVSAGNALMVLVASIASVGVSVVPLLAATAAICFRGILQDEYSFVFFDVPLTPVRRAGKFIIRFADVKTLRVVHTQFVEHVQCDRIFHPHGNNLKI